MLISDKTPHPDTLKKGDKIFISTFNAELFSIPYTHHLGEDFSFPEGIYEIKKLRHSPAYSGPKTPYLQLFAESLQDDKLPQLLLVLVDNGDALCAGSVIQDDPFRLAAPTRRDLDNLNNNRTHCVLCNKPLNIISAALKFCSHCDKKFDLT